MAAAAAAAAVTVNRVGCASSDSVNGSQSCDAAEVATARILGSAFAINTEMVPELMPSAAKMCRTTAFDVPGASSATVSCDGGVAIEAPSSSGTGCSVIARECAGTSTVYRDVVGECFGDKHAMPSSGGSSVNLHAQWAAWTDGRVEGVDGWKGWKSGRVSRWAGGSDGSNSGIAWRSTSVQICIHLR